MGREQFAQAFARFSVDCNQPGPRQPPYGRAATRLEIAAMQ
jgi:hypothetical protein